MSVIFNDLENKKILVTGANRGIGREIALHLGEQKAHVICSMRPGRDAFTMLQKEIENAGGKASKVEFSLNDSKAIKEELEKFLIKGGYPEILIRNLDYKDYLSTLFSSIVYKDIVKMVTTKMLCQELCRRFAEGLSQ